MEDCELVADKLGLPFNSTHATNSTDYPPNCSVYEGNVEVIFNVNTETTSDCAYFNLCVCEKHTGDGPAPGNCDPTPNLVL